MKCSCTETQVQSTAKFRAALEQSLPTIAFYGGISRPVQLQMGWQFTILQPLDGHYLVTFHANTLLVMEPESLLCVGAMTLGTAIVGVVTAGRHIFALCSGHQRPVVKLSLPAPQEKQVVAPPLGDTHPSCSSSQNRTPQAHCIDQEHERTACEKLDDDICLLETNLSGSTPATLTLSTRSPGSDSVLAGTETQGEPEPVLPILQPPNVPSPGNVSPSPLASERSMLLLTAVEAKLQLVADKFIPLGKKGEQQAAESISPVPAVVVVSPTGNVFFILITGSKSYMYRLLLAQRRPSAAPRCWVLWTKRKWKKVTMLPSALVSRRTEKLARPRLGNGKNTLHHQVRQLFLCKSSMSVIGLTLCRCPWLH